MNGSNETDPPLYEDWCKMNHLGGRAWDRIQAFTTDKLDWLGSRIREGKLLFQGFESMEALGASARITLSEGSEMNLATHAAPKCSSASSREWR
jgi:hypothetical protein